MDFNDLKRFFFSTSLFFNVSPADGGAKFLLRNFNKLKFRIALNGCPGFTGKT